VIPNYGDKYGAEALFSPEDALRAYDDGVPDVPPAVVVGFQDALTEVVTCRTDERVSVGRVSLYRLPGPVGYVQSRVGAPVAAGLVDTLATCGATAVCTLGSAASLSADLAPEDAVLPTRAIRDEGASYHYLPPDAPAEPAAGLVDGLDTALGRAGAAAHRGPTWTTSGFYRETVPEVHHYAAEGVLTCEMETAAVFAVADYRGIDAAAVHGIGDYLLEEWDPGIDHGHALDRLFEPVVDVLVDHVA